MIQLADLKGRYFGTRKELLAAVEKTIESTEAVVAAFIEVAHV